MSNKKPRQLNIFQILIRYSFSEDEWPKSGWIVLEDSPFGFVPVLTARKKELKFSKFEDALKWVYLNKLGYQISVVMDSDVEGKKIYISLDGGFMGRG